MLWKKLIAQLDIIQSNSMAKAANKILQFRFLLHHSFETIGDLQLGLPDILNQYNNMPAGSMFDLTPNDVLNGKTLTKNYLLMK